MRFYLRNDFPDRPGVYYVCWTDEFGRGRRRSTRSRDHATAQKVLARTVLELDRPRDQDPAFVTLQAVLVRYWHHHGRTRFAKEPIRYALAKVTEKIPKLAVVEFDTARQVRFMQELAADGLKPSTVRRYMGVIEAALNRARDHGELAAVPTIREPEEVHEQGLQPFSVDELRKLLAAARNANERMMVALWVGTCCRPGAVLDLTWDRIDLELGFIDFRVPGRRVVKKRRTVVPIAPTLAAYLREHRSVGYVVAWRTKTKTVPLKGFKVPMRRLAERAGVVGTAYRIRKGVASYLRAHGVHEGDVLGMLGHKYGAGHTERYARPGEMQSARDGVERLLREIAPPWLPLARDWQGAGSNVLNLHAANDPSIDGETHDFPTNY